MVKEDREACEKCAYNDEGSCSCFDRTSICCPYAEEAAYGLTFTGDAKKDIVNDCNFITHIISEICAYANNNGLEPDDTLRTMSENILALLEISTFNSLK